MIFTPTFHKIRNCWIFSIFSYSNFHRQLYISRISSAIRYWQKVSPIVNFVDYGKIVAKFHVMGK